MPDLIKLTITLQDQNQRHEQKYELFCRIPTCHATAPESFAQKRQAQDKQTQQPKTSEAHMAMPAKGAIAQNPALIPMPNQPISENTNSQPKATAEQT